MALPSFQWGDGIVDLQTSDGAALCTIKVFKTADAIGPQIVNRTGRGDTIAGSYRTGNLNGEGAYKGSMIGGLMPIPTNIASFVGTMVYQLDDGQTITVTSIIQNFSVTRDQTRQNSPEVSFKFKHTGNYVLPGGSLTATPPTLFIKQTDEGLTKTADITFGLDKHATRRYDLPSVTDTDAGEFSLLSSIMLTASTIPTGLKPDTINFVKTDRVGGSAILNLATTNPEDRIEIPETWVANDPEGLTSEASQAKVNSIPSVPAGFVERNLKVQAVDGVGNVKNVMADGLRTTRQDVEFPGTFVETDPSDLDTRGRQTIVYNYLTSAPAATVPAGLSIIGVTPVMMTASGTTHKASITYLFAEMSNKTKAEAQATRTYLDQNMLDSTADIAKVDATPTLPSPYIDRGTETRPLVLSGGTGRTEHLLNIKRGGTRSTADDVTYPKTVNVVDPTGIETRSTLATLVSGTMTPLVSSTGLKLNSTRVYQDARLRFVSVKELAPTNASDRILYKEAYSTRSPIDAFIDRNATLLSGLTTANTPSTIANAQVAALANIPFYYSTDVRKIDDTRAVITDTYYNPGKQVVGSTLHNPGFIPAKLFSGVVKVYVGQVRQRGSGSYWVALKSTKSSQYLRLFSLVRMMTPGSMIPDFASQLWNTNNSTFLGIASGNCLYLGAQYRTNIGLSGVGNFPFAMVYQFIQNPDGIFDLDGWSAELYTSTSIGTGWQPVSSFPQLAATIPTASDFSGFLA